MLKLSSVSVCAGKRYLLEDISLGIRPSGLTGLIGPNGTGKSTLMKVMAGVLTADSGECFLEDTPLYRLTPEVRARRIGYLPQKTEVAWPLAVYDLIALGRLPYQGMFKRESGFDNEKILQAARQTEVTHLLDRNAKNLSGGELTRVMLARVLATMPEVILADEPVASLDPYHQLHTLEILRSFANEGKTVLVSLHDLNLAYRFCDDVILMHEGKIYRQGSPLEVITETHVQAVYHVVLKQVKVDRETVLMVDRRVDN